MVLQDKLVTLVNPFSGCATHSTSVRVIKALEFTGAIYMQHLLEIHELSL